MAAPDSCLTLNRQKLLDAVNRRQIKREWLAEEIGVTPRTLRRWLHGQTTRVHIMHLDRLAEKIGCSLQELVSEGPAPEILFQSPDVHPVLRQLRQFVLQGTTQENFQQATQLIQSFGAELPFDLQAATLFEYARFAFQLGHISLAQRSFERAVMKADAAGVDSIRFQSFLSLAQLSSFQKEDGGERQALFLEQAEHVLLRMGNPHWRPYLWLMEGRLAVAQGQLGKALELGENAMVILQQDRHEPSLDTIEGLDILASIFHSVGRRRQAHEILTSAAHLAQRLLSAGHPMRGRLLMRQSSVNSLLGHHDLSFEQAQESVRILQAVLPLENPEMTSAWIFLGAALCENKMYAEGLEAMEKGLQGHPDHEARCRTNLGLFLQRMGRYEDSAVQGQQAVALFTAKFGPEHPETAAAMGRFAGALDKMGQVETAENMFRQAAHFLQKSDPFHVRILDQVRNQAVCLLKMNRADAAVQVLDEHRKIYTKRDESPTFHGRYNLLQAQALACFETRKDEALQCAVEARTRFQTQGVDPGLRHEAEALIIKLRD